MFGFIILVYPRGPFYESGPPLRVRKYEKALQLMPLISAEGFQLLFPSGPSNPRGPIF